MNGDYIKFRVMKDTPTVQGTLYKDDIVMVESKYKSFVNMRKIQVKDTTGKIWFVESEILEKL